MRWHRRLAGVTLASMPGRRASVHVMPATDEDAAWAIAIEIEGYLAEHPDAADTAAGIQRWWLPRRFADWPVASVTAALDRLVAQGVIVSVPLPDGRVLYTRRRAHRPRGNE